MTLSRQFLRHPTIPSLLVFIIFVYSGLVGFQRTVEAQETQTAANIPFPNRAPANPEIAPVQVRWEEGQTIFKMTLWWERGFLWMEISYNSLEAGFEQPPTICSEEFFIRQDDRTYNHVWLLDRSDQIWCNIIDDADRFKSQPPKVFRVTQNPSILPRADFHEDFALLLWLRRDMKSVKVDVFGAGNDLGSDPGMRSGPDDGDVGGDSGGDEGDEGGGSSADGQGSCFVDRIMKAY